MDRDRSGQRPQCQVCNRFFTPDPRQAERQVLCGRAECRRAYQRRWRQREYARNLEFCQRQKQRVSRWRRTHPGYWKRKPPATGPGPPAVTAAMIRLAGQVQRLDLTLAGYISQVTRETRKEELEPILVRCLERGRQIEARDLPG